MDLVDDEPSKNTQAELKDDSDKESFDERQLVIFKVGEEEFGVTINEVREIIRMEKITRIPNSPSYIEGVINLRGGIVVVVDLSKKLGLPRKEIDNDTRIIVIERDKSTVGMLVDSATEVLRLSGDKIRSAPSIVTKKIDVDYIEGVGILQKEVRGKEEKTDTSDAEQRLIILLDMVKVLDAKEIKAINNSSKDVDLPPESDKEKESTSTDNAGKDDSKLKENLDPKEKVEPKKDSSSDSEDEQNQGLDSSDLDASKKDDKDSDGKESDGSDDVKKKKESKSLAKDKPKSSTSNKTKSEPKKSKPKK